MRRLSLQVVVLVVVVGMACWGNVPGVHGQFALVSSGFSSPLAAPLISLRPGGGVGTIGGGGGAPVPAESRPPAPRRGASSRESEIAAIFRGVAYGAPTHSPAALTTSSSTTASTPTTATPTTATSTTTFTSPTSSTSTTTTTTTTTTPIPSRATQEVEVVWAGRGTGRPTEVYEMPIANSSDLTGVAGVRGSLGAAWGVHVYGSAGLLALVAAAALCSLAHAVLTPPRPRPPHLAVHTFVFLAAALRCLSLLHDPYGARGRLPPEAAAALWEAAWPCLTAALALLALLLLRAARRPPDTRPHAARALALLSALHVTVFLAARVAARLLPPHAAPLRAAARATAATWGGAVGGCVLWAAWRLENSGGGGRRGQLLGVRGGTRLAPAPAPALAIAASLAQLLLAALHLYLLAAPPVAPARPWAWWARVSLGRGLEVAAAAAVVGAAGLLARRVPPAAARRGDSAIFSVLSSCGRDGRPGLKGGHVFPEKQQHALRHALKPPPPPQWAAPAASHALASDFTLLWAREESASTPSMLVQEGGFVRFRTQEDVGPPPASPPAYTAHPPKPPPYVAQTLPPPARYYCQPCASLPRSRRPSAARRSQIRHATTSRRPQTLPPAATRPHTPAPPEYEVAPYTLPQPAAHTYATPHRPSLGRSAASSLSEEVAVDYLTDASNASSSDAQLRYTTTTTTIPRTLTLPLTLPLTSPSSLTSPKGGATPDSGLVLDFSPSQGAATPAARPGLLSKLVGGSMGGYAPLHVDDTSPPPLHAPPRPRYSAGTPTTDTVTPL